MELNTYMAILWRRKWIILIVTVVTFLVATIGTFMLPPTYEATATLFIATTADGNYQGGLTIYADRLKKTYAAIATSDPFLREIETKLDLQQKPEIIASPIANTELMKITAKYGHPSLAAEIANTIADMIVDESESSQQTRANPVQVLLPATEPVEPAQPNKKLNIALGLVAGLAGGLLLALLIESVDTTLYTSKQIEAVTNLSLLGNVPQIETKRLRRLPFVRGHDNSLVQGDAYRRIRTNIFTRECGKNLQTLLVASAMPGEGKSTVVSKLSDVVAQSGYKVIAIDGDLRKPTLHEIYSLPNEIGLSSLLQNGSSLEKTIQEVEGSQMHVLTSGPLPPNPSELLASSRMSVLLKELRVLYDVILIDTPALAAVSDAAVLAADADGVLLVVGQAQVRQEKVEATQEQLAMVNAKPIGVIVNRAQKPHGYSKYYEKLRVIVS